MKAFNELNEDEKALYLMRQGVRLRVNEEHHKKWLRIYEVAKMFDLSDEEVMKKAKEFELDITSNVVSVKSTINIDVAHSFIKFLLKDKDINTPKIEA